MQPCASCRGNYQQISATTTNRSCRWLSGSHINDQSRPVCVEKKSKIPVFSSRTPHFHDLPHFPLFQEMAAPSPPSLPLPGAVRQSLQLAWLRLISVQWPNTPRQWLELVSIWQDLAVYDDEKIRSGPISSILHELESLAADTINFAQGQAKTKEAAYWAHAAQYQIACLQQRAKPARRALLIIGTATLVLTIIIPQIAIAFRLQEWSTVARATSDHARTVVMFIALARFQSINLPLIWLFAQNRLIGSLPSIIFYSIPAFYKPLRYLYGTASYTYAVIPVLLVWLVLISFSAPLRTAWMRCRAHKEPHLTGERLVEGQLLSNRWQQLILRLEREMDTIHTSDVMGQLISLVKKYVESTCSALHHAQGTSSPAQTHYPRPEKFAILVAAVACMLADIVTNLDKPFFLTEKVAINTWVTARLFWCAWSPHQSTTDMLKLCCDLLSGTTLSLAFVTWAKIGRLFTTNKNLVVLTSIHTAIIFLFARHTAILYRAIGNLVMMVMTGLRSFATSIRWSPQFISTQHHPQDIQLPTTTIEEHEPGLLVNVRPLPL